MNAVDEGRRVQQAVAPAQQAEAVQTLYARRIEIYPRSRIGDRLAWFQKWRWAAVWATQIVFYGLPWLMWNERQAVLFDLGARRFYLFGLVLWPQDIVFLTALLIIAAIALFLFTAVGGRLWCGYACPQTVYTEIFMWIERRIEGDRVKRMILDREPLTARKFALKLAKHAAWIAVALWTGYTFVGYFTPIRELGTEMLALQIGGWSAFWVLFYGFATYGNAGWMREQVCKYMCPYARFQSAMFDKDTLDLGLGHCVDCGLCVQVCPTGIDIRNGLQYECIGCAACIDACDYTMEKVGLPKGLVRYSTTHAMRDKLDSRAMWRRVFRPRVLVYGAFLLAVTAALAAALALRVPLKVDLIRDRGALASEADDGRVENTYRMQVSNTTEARRTFTVTASGLPGLTVASETRFEVGPAAVASIPLRLLADADQVTPGSHRIAVEVRAEDDPRVTVHETTTFLGLRR